MNLQIVIIAHGNGQAAFDRHLGYWLKHMAEMLICSPEDDPVKTHLRVLPVAGAQHNGMQALVRLMALLHALESRDWNICRIYEYDSFDLNPTIVEERGFFGVPRANVESPKFTAPVYANPPWTFDRASFEEMLGKARAYPSLSEAGEADRWLSALAYLAGVPILPYDPPGFSQGTIGAGDIENLRTAIYMGTTVLHGIKHAWTQRAAEQFYDERNLKAVRDLRTRAGRPEFLP